MSASVWFRAARVPFLAATGVPVVLGTVLGWREGGSLDWALFAVTLLGALLMHAGANLLNEHGDHLGGADAANPFRTPLSGGSGVIQEGLLSPGAVLRAGLSCLAVGGALGLYLNSVSPGNIVLLLGLAGVALAWAYSEGPTRLAYRGSGVGELAVAAAFGPLPVVGAFYVQAGIPDPSVVAVSLPLALLIALVLTVNGFPDYDSDRTVGKRTLVVTLGKKRASAVCHALFVAVYVLTVWFVFADVLPAWCLLSLATTPLAWQALSALRGRSQPEARFSSAGGWTVLAHGLYGLLLAAGLVVDRLV